MMTVAYCSDLHLMYGADGLALDHMSSFWPAADILILAGDVVEVSSLLRDEKSSKYSERLLIDKFFKAVTGYYPRVLYVPGNHEFYGTDYKKSIDLLRALGTQYPNLDIMIGDTAVIDNIVFFGDTLWTDLSNPLDASIAEYSMNDYRLITSNYRPIKTGFTTTLHYETVSKIRSLSHVFPNLEKVIITHHLPSEKSVAPRYQGNSLNPAFFTNLEDVISDIRPAVWIHGHTHNQFDYYLGDTRILCNPRGYQGYESSVGAFVVKTFII